MRLGRFLLLNAGYWLLATSVLFVNSWSNAQRHIDVAVVRYVYLLLIGMLISLAMAALYDSASFQQAPGRPLWVAFVSFMAGLLTALLLNPITYLMVGYNIHTVPHEILSTGTLYFMLIYLVWSLIYIQLADRPILNAGAAKARSAEPLVFPVEKLGERRQLQDRDICCFVAKGDYVELVTATNSYLFKDTLAGLERRLDGDRFRRVHRSTIVNRDKIERVARKSGGAYEIELEGGHSVTSSRSYKSVVEAILPGA